MLVTVTVCQLFPIVVTLYRSRVTPWLHHTEMMMMMMTMVRMTTVMTTTVNNDSGDVWFGVQW